MHWSLKGRYIVIFLTKEPAILFLVKESADNECGLAYGCPME